MLLSATERFHEIGTMKCLGALSSLIIRLFSLESIFQGLVGTTAGILIGLVFAVVEAGASYGADVWLLLPWIGLLKGIGVCMVIGTTLSMLGALYPVWYAARMQPAVALRSKA